MSDQKPLLDELNKVYKEGEEIDEDLFAEMRSNVLLVSGNHYAKRGQMYSAIRSSKSISDTQKIRITKNHIQKITTHYQNVIASRCPTVAVVPRNDLDMQNRKQAELNQSVWADAKDRYKLSEKRREWINNFVQLGEVACFVYFDPNLGEVTGYHQAMDENGEPVFEPGEPVQGQPDPMTGQPTMQQGEPKPVADPANPQMSGEFVFKSLYGWNIRRPGGCVDMRTSPLIMVSEMVDAKELKDAYKDDPRKLKIIGDEDSTNFIVFDSTKQKYEATKQIELRYHFYRPSKRFPKGWFVISKEEGILEESELPFGVFPIAWKGFREYASNPRGYSIIKVARPFQAEVNRAASQMVQHQITVGDDKIIYQSGSKLAPGALLPGVRGLTYNGAPPQILPGRDGSQFANYITGTITEMYDACDMQEIEAENESGQLDPHTLLFRSASEAEKYKGLTDKFEEFQAEVCMIFLALAKHYYPDDMVIMAAGKSERVNIPEFRSTMPISYQVKTEAGVDTADTKLGRQITLTHVLQYVGSQLPPNQIGMILKEMPFLNNKTLFKKLTTDYDNAENDMLSIERGTMPDLSPYADNKTYVDALTQRMKQPDFGLLDPLVQHGYQMYLQQHEQAIAQKAQAIQRAESGFIPTDGALITCSMQLPDKTTPGKTHQVRLPYAALNWLVTKLEDQGMAQDQIQSMNQGAVAQIAQGMPQQAPAGEPPAQAFQSANVMAGGGFTQSMNQ